MGSTCWSLLAHCPLATWVRPALSRHWKMITSLFLVPASDSHTTTQEPHCHQTCRCIGYSVQQRYYDAWKISQQSRS
ncbi:hypothetical protein BDV24DRAFT_141383 [Aspergillus arachidicola]|uniref:Secreted protein n=1 Tax=Aspergillus arachidicola TaxID=656916 RepID=A0A5N6XU00_9EURO|nr:hypothetical protein BDV24DRAFT_141383 [Aspergillus arachidicola]